MKSSQWPFTSHVPQGSALGPNSQISNLAMSPWGIQTPQQSLYIHSPNSHSLIYFQAQPFAAIFILLIPATSPQPNDFSRQLCHLTSIKPDGAWDITGFYSHPCPRAGSEELTATSLLGSICLVPFLPKKAKLLGLKIWDLSQKNASLGAEHPISFRPCWNTAVTTEWSGILWSCFIQCSQLPAASVKDFCFKLNRKKKGW